MEGILKSQLGRRHDTLQAYAEQAKEIIDKSGDEVSLVHLTKTMLGLRSSIKALKEEIQFTLGQPQLDLQSLSETINQYQIDQGQAEEYLVILETMKLVSGETPASTSTSKLPKLELKKFNGNLLHWNAFIDTFNANINNKNISDVEKLSYLMTSLQDSPLQTIEGLAVTNENFKVAMDLLVSRYGKKEKVISAHYEALTKLQRCGESGKECRQVLNTIERHLRVLESMGENVNNGQIRSMIYQKFPPSLLYQLNISAPEETDVGRIRTNLEQIISAKENSLNEETETPSEPNFGASTAAALFTAARKEKMKRPQSGNPKRPDITSTSRKRAATKNLASLQEKPAKKRRFSCIFCNGNHYNDECEALKSIKDRKEFLKGRCFLCFKKNHNAKQCERKLILKCYYCKEHHNRALCPKRDTPRKNGNSNISTFQNSSEITPCMLNNHIRTCLQTATASVTNKGHSMVCRLLLDTGSQRSYMTHRLAKKLNLDMTNSEQLLIYTFGSNEPTETESAVAKITIKTKRDIVRELRVNIVPHITDRIPISDFIPDSMQDVDIWADDDSAGCGIDLLIGNDYYFTIIRNKRITLDENLHLIDTDLGWMVSGSILTQNTDNALTIITYCQDPACPSLTQPDLPLRDSDMKFLWSLENIGITDSPKTTREEEAVNFFNETVCINDGRYEVKWPWVQYPPELPTNYGLAFGRLKGLWQRLDTDTTKEYDSILKEQLEAGIIEIVPENSIHQHPIHYLPHHIVKQENKKGRIVYDASAKIKGEKSLNECMYKGPSMIEDLTGLLINFRTKRIGITADVEKAFLMVALQEDDRDVTRFLWLKDPTKEPSEENLLLLRFCRVPFGVVASPFLLTATIRYHMTKTDASLLKEIADKCYVDNLVTCADNLQEAIDLYERTSQTFKEMSMNIRDWTSNDQAFNDSIPETQLNKNPDKVKVLGLIWNQKEDTLSLKEVVDTRNKNTKGNKTTKRDILREMASIYDPCGYAAPLLLPVKILFQELCKRKVKWDQDIPEDLLRTWQETREKLQIVNNIVVPRYAGLEMTETNIEYELHAFTDASTRSYAAVVYLSSRSADRAKQVLLMAKSRVAPLKDQENLKIPRLELLGYLIGSRLLKYIKDNLDIKISQQYLWTDSLVVLGWIRSQKLLPPFVARRVEEIKQNQDVAHCYVNTDLNPADLATRPELWERKKDVWFNGPDFLAGGKSEWPSEKKREDDISLFTGEGLPTAEEPRAQQPQEQQMKTTSEMDTIRTLQKECYPEEMAGKTTNLSRNLDLYLDVDGVLRCRGRLTRTSWSYDKKHPILLPPNKEFTRDIIMDTHKQNYHVGVSHTLSIVREKYWIPTGKSQVQKVLRNCFNCKKHCGGPYALPPTPALPAERVRFSPPFSFIGVDYFGPLYMSSDAGTVKRWICLFTCLAVRAIHLEIVADLTAQECLLALRRLIAIRGRPELIVSDNALQFKLTSEVVSSTVCSDKNIKWKFIPQLAPWHGGFYERMVGIVKQCIKRTLEKHLISERHLPTIIKEIEAVVNTRPLTSVGSELEDVLRPVDFLNLGRCPEIEPKNLEITDMTTTTKQDLITGWKRTRTVLKEFVDMFENRYLPSLRERFNNSYKQGRVKSKEIAKVGDLVQIKGESKNRENWRVGRITALFEGSDGHHRVAKVKVGDKEFTRSLGHLFPLEIESDEKEEMIQGETAETRKETAPTSPLDLQGDGTPIYDDLLEQLPENMDTSEPIESNKTDNVIGCPQELWDDIETEPQNNEEEPAVTEDTEDSCVKETRDKKAVRGAALRAREKIAEWTRQLVALL